MEVVSRDDSAHNDSENREEVAVLELCAALCSDVIQLDSAISHPYLPNVIALAKSAPSPHMQLHALLALSHVTSRLHELLDSALAPLVTSKDSEVCHKAISILSRSQFPTPDIFANLLSQASNSLPSHLRFNRISTNSNQNLNSNSNSNHMFASSGTPTATASTPNHNLLPPTPTTTTTPSSPSQQATAATTAQLQTLQNFDHNTASTNNNNTPTNRKSSSTITDRNSRNSSLISGVPPTTRPLLRLLRPAPAILSGFYSGNFDVSNVLRSVECVRGAVLASEDELDMVESCGVMSVLCEAGQRTIALFIDEMVLVRLADFLSHPAPPVQDAALSCVLALSNCSSTSLQLLLASPLIPCLLAFGSNQLHSLSLTHTPYRDPSVTRRLMIVLRTLLRLTDRPTNESLTQLIQIPRFLSVLVSIAAHTLPSLSCGALAVLRNCVEKGTTMQVAYLACGGLSDLIGELVILAFSPTITRDDSPALAQRRYHHRPTSESETSTKRLTELDLILEMGQMPRGSIEAATCSQQSFDFDWPALRRKYLLSLLTCLLRRDEGAIVVDRLMALEGVFQQLVLVSEEPSTEAIEAQALVMELTRRCGEVMEGRPTRAAAATAQQKSQKRPEQTIHVLHLRNVLESRDSNKKQGHQEGGSRSFPMLRPGFQARLSEAVDPLCPPVFELAARDFLEFGEKLGGGSGATCGLETLLRITAPASNAFVRLAEAGKRTKRIDVGGGRYSILAVTVRQLLGLLERLQQRGVSAESMEEMKRRLGEFVEVMGGDLDKVKLTYVEFVLLAAECGVRLFVTDDNDDDNDIVADDDDDRLIDALSEAVNELCALERADLEEDTDSPPPSPTLEPQQTTPQTAETALYSLLSLSPSQTRLDTNSLQAQQTSESDSGLPLDVATITTGLMQIAAKCESAAQERLFDAIQMVNVLQNQLVTREVLVNLLAQAGVRLCNGGTVVIL
eukprot:c20793_g1_i1.p1 GENE.c20793_g1_i1~~c20793_g1_i1.p1  ORF type:complete len:962 (-),score=236.07 c20793_g1_i1:156-3041(-)